MKSRYWFAALALVFTASYGQRVSVTLKQMKETSGAILVGKVKDIAVSDEISELGTPFSIAKIIVETVVEPKDINRQIVRVKYVAGWGESPGIKIGERYVLFLRPFGEYFYPVETFRIQDGKIWTGVIVGEPDWSSESGFIDRIRGTK